MPVQQNEDTQALDRICGGDLSPDTPRLKEETDYFRQCAPPLAK
ncbi:hypothetical protein N8586_00080 [Verrucomicrobiales bacterium]|nr:hypothetical protein [Verrucomicrobiales bacterium]MDF1788975.1 hypothetical protein [Verrucomicrobiales bacterium]